MTEGSAPQYRGANGEEEVNAWGIGLILFASLLMMLGGAFQVFTGLVAIFNDQFLIPRPASTCLSSTAPPGAGSTWS